MKRILLILLVILGITSIGHALVLPQATKCLLVDFYDFDVEENIYFRQNIPFEKREEIKSIVKAAEKRVAAFWGEKTVTPKFIYCGIDEDYKKFGSPFSSPAAAVMHIGAYVVISKEGVDLDIISHELSHTEFFERVGLINRSLKIPVWFDEGLAMQVDHRSYYSIDTLKSISDNFQTLPEVTKMTNYSSFGSGTRDEVMMNYRTAKYEVHKWYSPQKLESFIDKINDGKTFEEAYSNY